MITLNFSPLKETRPHEYAVRFLFGGACTAIAGWIAYRFGPEVGGLFLAFPAIFPASACLIERHERQRKAKAGFDGTNRSRIAAGVEASGTSLGAVALGLFALTVWLGLPHARATFVIPAATVVWVLVAWHLWIMRKSRLLNRRRPRVKNAMAD